MIKIIKSLALIGIVAAAGLTMTDAYFSDTELSEGNTFTAGQLDLSVNDTAVPGPVVTITDLKPSLVQYSDPITLKITNNPGRVFKHIKEATCDTGAAGYKCDLGDLAGDMINVTNDAECDEILKNLTDTIPASGLDNNDLPSKIHFNLEKWIGPNDPVEDSPLCKNVTTKENCWDMIIEEDETKWLYEDYTSCWIPVAEFGEPLVTSSIIIRQSFHLDKDVTNWAQGDKCTFEEDFMVLQMNDDTKYPVNETSGVKRVWDSTVEKCVDCVNAVEICDDGFDNDCDGEVDEADCISV